MAVKEVEGNKMTERIEFGIELMKKLAKENNVDFDKDLLIQGTEIGKTMFVRSEIAYSSNR